MSLSPEQQKALDDLAAPASLDRIVRFLSDLGTQGTTPLGASGRSASAFASSLAVRRTSSFSARQASGWVAILMDRYQIKIGEFQEFALWFVQRQEILSETEDQVVQDQVVQDPPARSTAPALVFVTAKEEELTPDAATDTAQSRRSSRLRRVERKSLAPAEKAAALEAADPETSTLEPAQPDADPPRRPFRLTPKMVTRPAFLTNIGLAGMLAGLSLSSASAASAGAPAMTLAAASLSTASLSGLSPASGSLLPTYPAYSPAAFPTAAGPMTPAAFTPSVTPMTPSPASPVWLGQPPPVTSLPLSSLTLPVPQTLDSLPGIPADTLVGASLSATSASAVRAAPAASPPPAMPPVSAGAPITPSALPASQKTFGLAPAAPTLMGLAAGSAALALAGRFYTPSPAETFGTFARPQTLRRGSAPAPASVPSDMVPSSAFSPPAGASSAPAAALSVTPEMGQLTLLAPPLQVASTQAEQSGIAASLDWQTLAAGAGPLDEGGMARLAQALPDRASLLYPALPVGSLGSGAVNLPLAAPLVHSLLQRGYASAGLGSQAAPTAPAAQAASLGAAALGGRPHAAPLSAQLVPSPRPPAGSASGVLNHPAETAGGSGALAEAGKQAKRGGVLDFLGVPVRLAPSLTGRLDLARETTARNTARGPGQPTPPLRPELFAPLRQRLFPAFQSMTVEPNKAAWQKAAPSFGLRDGSPATVLSPASRILAPTSTSPQPPSRSRPSISSPTAHAPGGPLALSQLWSGRKPAPPPVPKRQGGQATAPSHVPSGHAPSVHAPVHASAHAAPPVFSASGFGSGLRSMQNAGIHVPGVHAPAALVSPSLGSRRLVAASLSSGPAAPPFPMLSLPATSGRKALHPAPAFIPRTLSPGSSGSGHSAGPQAGHQGGTTPLATRSRPRFAVPLPPPSHAWPMHSEIAAELMPHPAQNLASSQNLVSSPRYPAPSVPGLVRNQTHFPPSRLVSSPVAQNPQSLRLPGAGPAAPPMTLAPRASRRPPGPTGTAAPLAVQRSTHSSVTPAANQNAPARTPAVPGPNGAASGEVGAMANEVWSLLKRRLATEAERRGRW